MVRDGLGYESRPQPATVDYRTSPPLPLGNYRRVTVAGSFLCRCLRSPAPPPLPSPAIGCEKLILYSFFIIFRKNRVLEVWFLKLDIFCKIWLRDGLGHEPKPIRSTAGPPNSKNEYYTQFSPFFVRVVFMISIFWNWTSFIKYVWKMSLVMN